MQAPQKPDNEAQRLLTLRSSGLLDSLPETRFDAITRTAQLVFNVPTALISLVDAERNWFKSSQGMRLSETGRDISFCGHTILGKEILVVADTTQDPRFVDNPLVIGEQGVRFYAGCPVQARDGCNLGTLCVFDIQPREFGDTERQILRSLTSLVECELETLYTAHYDELTGLINHRGLLFLGGHSTKLCQRSSINLTMLLFDLNQFVSFNQEYGEDYGDLVLMDFAMLLRKVFRESDLLARTGGDEFVVLLVNTDRVKAVKALQRFQQTLKEYNHSQNRSIQLGMEAAVVELDHGHHGDIQALLADAWSKLRD